TGDCASYSDRIEAPGASEVGSTQVADLVLGIPFYCTAPGNAYCWLQGAGAQSQLVTDVPFWQFRAPRAVVDAGDVVRHHPRIAPGGSFAPDTALVAVWSDERTGVPQIRAQRVTWNGVTEWGPSGLLIAPTGTAQTEPDVVRLQDASSLVVWL